MTEAVKNFLEVNYELLDTNPNEFVHWAYNGLNRAQQKELVAVLSEAGINIESAIEAFIRFHISMTMETIERPVELKVFVIRYFTGIMGLDTDWIVEYILENKQEWDNKIARINGSYKLFPVIDQI